MAESLSELTDLAILAKIHNLSAELNEAVELAQEFAGEGRLGVSYENDARQLREYIAMLEEELAIRRG